MSLRDSLLALLVMAIWGLNFVVAKWGLAEFPPLFIMALRFVLVAALLVPFARIPRGKMLPIAVLSVTLGSIHFPLMFTGLNGIDAATASLAAQAQVPFSSLLASILFKDKLGGRRALGMATAFAGVMVIAGEPRLAGSLTPMLMILAASFAFAIASMQMKTIIGVDGFALNGWMALFAAPQLLVLSLLLEDGHLAALGNASAWGWGSIAYMAIGVTIIAYGLWYPLLRKYAVNQTMPYLLTVPVFGVAAGVMLMGDPFTLRLVLGGCLTLGGVAFIVQRRPNVVGDKVTNPT
ncbi:DMT family transporter [Azospirillum rugosum]|uniref:O-acetylserine/cysteine efflux transporter n=1 Tax=Azospirillum rugosum TaxID=416170 RepID=A0ABS4SRY4_9PROT|nr:EamA family transporter [Azospirillum rugosum]MBP2295326.1 O-acetylserine/cysteine efflux transporter [Azospirillum rugosum]MDQ0528701.1 O-acetylserine/cysteine efflux transporter [Azospirillum rugosum]